MEGIVIDNANSSLTISSVVTGSVAAGSVGLSIGGPGTLTLSGANTYTGNTDLDAGTLIVGNTTAVGAAADSLNIIGGTIQAASGGTTSAGTTAAGGLVEVTNTVTVTIANTFTIGETVVISGAVPAGFNGTYTILTATAALFTYTDATSGLATSTGGASVVAQNFTLVNPIQLNTGAGFATFAGANSLALTGVISGAGSVDFNLNNSATVSYGSQTNTYTGVTNVINGTLALGNGGDKAFSATNAGEGILLSIGNGQIGTQAIAFDNGNNIPNDTTTIINNTGTLTIGAAAGTAGTGDAVGGFILNGGSWQQVSANVEDAIVVEPSAIPATVSGAAIALARNGGVASSEGAGYNVINVFQGVGAALGNELTISNQILVGITGSGFTVTKIGAGTVTLTGATASSYTEPTIVDEGSLVLARTAAALAGELVVGAYSGTQSVRVLSNTNQLSATANTIVNASGTLNLAPSGSVETVNLTGATAGTFQLTLSNVVTSTGVFGTGTTAAIPFNASPVQVQTALTNLLAGAPFNFTNAVNDVVVDGGPGLNSATAGSYTVFFQNDLANQDILAASSPGMTLVTTGLTGTPTGISAVYAGTSAVVGTIGTLDLHGGTVSIGNAQLTVSSTITGLAFNGTTTNQIVNNFSSVATATGTGTIATIMTTAPDGYQVGQLVNISGVSVAGYNGNFTITSIPTPTTFTYANATTTSGTGGLVQGINEVIAASPTGATESGNTVTITTTAGQGLQVGQTISIAGVGLAGYNGDFTIASVPTVTTFTYLDSASGQAASGGGMVTVVAAAAGPLTGGSGLLTLGATDTINTADANGIFGLSIPVPITGAFGITKGGNGTLNLDGTVANIYTGTTTVNTGTLLLNDTGGVAVSGALTVGDSLGGQGSNKADVVTLLASNQIQPTAAVIINNSGLLDLNGFNQHHRHRGRQCLDHHRRQHHHRNRHG